MHCSPFLRVRPHVTVQVQPLHAAACPFRHESNSLYARTRFMLGEALEEYYADSDFEVGKSPDLARGDREPLLNLPVLGNGSETQ